MDPVERRRGQEVRGATTERPDLKALLGYFEWAM